MRNEDQIRLQHMLDAVEKAIKLTHGKSRKILDIDETLTLAVERLLEIIGEASRNISEETKQNHPEISWSQINAFRNRLAHGYFDIDLDILWEIIIQDLPPLANSLEKIIAI